MADILSVGAGASEGLDRLLAQHIIEEKLNEQKRSNRADESFREKQLEESQATQRMQQLILNQYRQGENATREENSVRDLIKLRPAGSTVSAKDYERERNVGHISDDFYDKMGATTGDDAGTGPGVIKFRGTSAELKPAAEKTSNTKSYKLRMPTGQSRDIVGVETPAGRVMYQGQDVTDRVEPYVPPWQPQLLQTGSGYGLADKHSGKVTPVTDASGGQAPLATPSQIRTRADAAQRVGSHIDDVINEAQEMDKLGLMGPIGGRWSDFAAGRWGSAQDIGTLIGHPLTPEQEEKLGEFRADVGLMKSGTAMVHGGARGGGSIQMMEYFNKLMNANKMDINLFKGTANSFKKWLKKYAELDPGAQESVGPQQDSGSGAGSGGSSDLYQQYLNRPKQ